MSKLEDIERRFQTRRFMKEQPSFCSQPLGNDPKLEPSVKEEIQKQSDPLGSDATLPTDIPFDPALQAPPLTTAVAQPRFRRFNLKKLGLWLMLSLLFVSAIGILESDRTYEWRRATSTWMNTSRTALPWMDTPSTALPWTDTLRTIPSWATRLWKSSPTLDRLKCICRPLFSDPPPTTDHRPLKEYDSVRDEASVVPSLTSPTFQRAASPPRSDVAWWMSLFGNRSHLPFEPATVLQDDIIPNRCWPFSGTYGTLGIDLGRDVFPINITIGHHLTQPLPDAAPREVIIWGLVNPSYPLNTTSNESTNRSFPSHLFKPSPKDTPMFLGYLHYDRESSQALQSLMISDGARETACRKILIEIVDNWGSKRYTCLYYLRIRGFY